MIKTAKAISTQQHEEEVKVRNYDFIVKHSKMKRTVKAPAFNQSNKAALIEIFNLLKK